MMIMYADDDDDDDDDDYALLLEIVFHSRCSSYGSMSFEVLLWATLMRGGPDRQACYVSCPVLSVARFVPPMATPVR